MTKREDKEQRGRRKRRRREREDPFLTLLKEDIKYQREADERRAAETREQANGFFALLERLAEKLHNCYIEPVVVFLMLLILCCIMTVLKNVISDQT